MKLQRIMTTLTTIRGNVWVVGGNCLAIDENQARGEGDRWFYDVIIEDNDEKKICRIFDMAEVTFVIRPRERRHGDSPAG